MPPHHTASIISAVKLHLWLHARWHTGLGCTTHTHPSKTSHGCLQLEPATTRENVAASAPDNIADAVLRKVWCMAQNAGLYGSSLDEIFVPSCCHNTMNIDDSVQFALVGRGLLKRYSAVGSGGSLVLRERAAALGIMLIGLVMGVSLGASTLRQLGNHLTAFMQAPKPVQSGGAGSPPRGTASYTSSSSSGGSNTGQGCVQVIQQ
jgi:hypothetical protein